MKCVARLIVFLLVCGMASWAWAGAEEEVAQVFQQFAQAIHESNAEAIGAVFAEEAYWVPALSPFRVESRKAIQALWAGLFKAFPTARITLHHELIRVYDGRFATRSAYFRFSATNPKGESIRFDGRSSSALAKIGGKWLIVNHHTSRLPGSQ